MTTVAPPMPERSAKSGPARPAAEIETRRVLNLPLLIASVVAVAVLSPAAYFWHSFMMNNSASVYLQRAEELEGDEDWNRAAQYLHHYLTLRPDDVDVRIRLARTFDRSADDIRRKPRAAELYARAVGLAPDDVPLRRRLAELSLELRRFSVAEEEAKELLQRETDEPIGLRILAICGFAKFRTNATGAPSQGELVASFEKAISKNPGDTELAAMLAHIYRHELKQSDEAERNQQADQVMNRLVESNPESSKAYLARFQYRRQYKLPGGGEDIEKAVELGPREFAVLVQAGEHALNTAREASQAKNWGDASERYRQAEEFFKRAISLEPDNEQGHVGLGQTYVAQNKGGLAIDTWRNGLAAVGHDNIELNARLVSLMIALGRMDECIELLDALDKEIVKRGTDLPRQVKTAAEAAVKFLRAKWHTGKGEHRQAVAILKEVVVVQAAMVSVGTTQRAINEHYEAWMLMGQSYSALGQWDLAAGAFEKAASVKPESREAKIAAANARNRAGQHEIARLHLKAVVDENTEQTPAAAWLTAAEIDLQQQLTRAKDSRQWEQLHQRLASPPEELRTSWQLQVLKADYVVARGGEAATEAAMRFLGAAEALHAGSPDLYQRLVLMYQRLGKSEEADRALKHLQGLVGNSVRSFLVQSELLALRSQVKEAQQLLRKALGEVPDDQRSPIRYGLAQLYLHDGQVDAAKKELEILQKAHPADLNLLNQLAELALDRQDYDEVQRWEDEIRTVDGPDSTRWRYFRALRLLEQADNERDPALHEVAELHTHIEGQRPTWASGYLVKGQLALRQNNIDGAIRAYQMAIELGESRIRVYEILIQLLRQQQRFADAREYLARLQDFVSSSRNLTNIEISDAVRLGDTARAVALAQEGVQLRPKDPVERIRLGQTLVLDDRNEEAEQEFREAAKLGPDDVQTWNALFGYYMHVKNNEMARTILERLPQGVKLTEVQRKLFLARGYEMLQDRGEARKYYLEAQKLAPDDVEVHMHLIEFLAGSDVAEAEKNLRAAMKRFPDEPRLRRRLAQVLVLRGGESEWQEASSLLDQLSTQKVETSLLDKRMLAEGLARRGGEANRKKAIGILEQVVASREVTPNDRLLLARLYEADSKIEQARQQYLVLAGGDNPNPVHLAMFVDLQLRHGGAETASRWLKRLSELDANGFNTISLQARWLKEGGRSDEIEARVEKAAREWIQDLKTNEQRAQLCQNVGNLYTTVELHEAAEPWYDRLVRLMPKAYQPLAQCYAAQGRIPDAIRLCREKAESDDSPQPALVLASVLTTGKPIQEDYAMAEPLFAQALGKHGNDVGLLFSMALVRAMQDRPEEAIAYYQKVLELHPRHVPTLNNLAYVLLDVPGRQKEGLQYIDRAIEITGRQPALLDTKGMLLLDDSPQEAVRLLEEATALPSPDPRYQFHLAVAYHRAGAKAKARTALEQARAGGLENQSLTASERRLLGELQEALPR